jgi:N-carbamoylputrescine amidase
VYIFILGDRRISIRNMCLIEDLWFSAGPTGEIVKLANDKDEEVLVAEFDLDEIKSTRHGWGIFRDRRPELYKVLLTLDGEK